MKLLLDTHILLWALFQKEHLPKDAADYLADERHEVYYSAAALWEVETKYLTHRAGMPFTAAQVLEQCDEAGFQSLPLEGRHVLNLKNLRRKEDSPPHKDPFDRIMICQAITESMWLMTHDHLLQDYEDVPIISV